MGGARPRVRAARLRSDQAERLEQVLVDAVRAHFRW